MVIVKKKTYCKLLLLPSYLKCFTELIYSYQGLEKKTSGQCLLDDFFVG